MEGEVGPEPREQGNMFRLSVKTHFFSSGTGQRGNKTYMIVYTYIEDEDRQRVKEKTRATSGGSIGGVLSGGIEAVR